MQIQCAGQHSQALGQAQPLNKVCVSVCVFPHACLNLMEHDGEALDNR